MKILKTQNKLCLSCMEEHEVQEVALPEQNVFNDKLIHYIATYEYCSYADEYTQTEEMIRKNDVAFKNAYKKQLNLLTSDEIIAIRSIYNVSQKDFAVILGWGLATITRYENYQVQDTAHDDVLRKIKEDPKWFLQLLERSRENLSSKAYQKYSKRANAVIKSKKNEFLKEFIEMQYIDINGDEQLTGGTVLNLDKVVEVVNIFALQVQNLYKVKLMKFLWYADFLHYKRTGKSITGLAYRALPMGAVPEAHETLISLDNICFEEVLINGNTAYKFAPVLELTAKNLSADELDVIGEVIRKFGKMNTKDIIDTMHEEEAYKKTAANEYILYKYANQLSLV